MPCPFLTRNISMGSFDFHAEGARSTIEEIERGQMHISFLELYESKCFTKNGISITSDMGYTKVRNLKSQSTGHIQLVVRSCAVLLVHKHVHLFTWLSLAAVAPEQQS